MTITASAFRAVNNLHMEHAADFAVVPGVGNPQTIVASKGASLFDLLLSEQLGSTQQPTAEVPRKTSAAIDENGFAQLAHEADSHAIQTRLAGSTNTATANSWLKFTSSMNSTASINSTAVPTAHRELPKVADDISVGGEKQQSSSGTPDEAVSDAKAQTTGSNLMSDVATPIEKAPTAGSNGMDSAQPKAGLASPFAVEVATREIVQQFSQSVINGLTNLIVDSGSSAATTKSDAGRPPVAAMSATTQSNQRSLAAPAATNGNRSNGTSSENEPRTEFDSLLVHPSSTPDALKKSLAHINTTTVQVSSELSTTDISRSATTQSSVSFSEALTSALTQFVDSESHGGPTNVRIQLDLPDLGTVNLIISLTEKVVSLRIVTENELTQKIVEGQISDLRQSLTNGGIECGLFHVGFDSTIRQRPRQKDVRAANSPSRQPVSTRWNGTQPSPQSNDRPNGLFDFVA